MEPDKCKTPEGAVFHDDGTVHYDAIPFPLPKAWQARLKAYAAPIQLSRELATNKNDFLGNKDEVRMLDMQIRMLTRTLGVRHARAVFPTVQPPRHTA